MDIVRPKTRTPLWKRPRVLLGAGLAVALSGAGFAARMGAGAMSVDAETLRFAEVQRGPMQVTVQANGVLVPSVVRYVAAQVEGRVDEVKLKAGAAVKTGEVLVQLSNPVLNQQAEEARWSLEALEAELNALRVQLDSELLNSQSTVAKAQFEYESAELQRDAQAKLIATHVVSQLEYKKSELKVKQLAETLKLEQQRLARFAMNLKAQLQAKEAQVGKLRKIHQRANDQVAALTVRAPLDGIVQESPLQVGQRVLVGANLMKVAQPESLYAELQVQEILARDLAVGQEADVDLRNGVVKGRVSRVDLAVTKGIVKVDVQLLDALPKGARPDLSVEGRVRVSDLPDVLHVKRPVQAQSGQTTTIFRVNADGLAERVQVQYGVASAQEIEIRGGLSAGEKILLSDASQWAKRDSLKFN